MMRDLFTDIQGMQQRFDRGMCRFGELDTEGYTKHMQEELPPDYRDCMSPDQEEQERMKRLYQGDK